MKKVLKILINMLCLISVLQVFSYADVIMTSPIDQMEFLGFNIGLICLIVLFITAICYASILLLNNTKTKKLDDVEKERNNNKVERKGKKLERIMLICAYFVVFELSVIIEFFDLISPGQFAFLFTLYTFSVATRFTKERVHTVSNVSFVFFLFMTLLIPFVNQIIK